MIETLDIFIFLFVFDMSLQAHMPCLFFPSDHINIFYAFEVKLMQFFF